MSEYTDIKNNTYKIIQRSLDKDKEKEDNEAEIIDRLYYIFINK